jgi:hypothetical protein
MGVWTKLAWLFLSVALLVGATTGAFAQPSVAGNRTWSPVLDK